MPVLDCTVVSCAYNSEKKCSKGDIQVGGTSATVTSETCCSSFRQRGTNGASNSTGEPKDRASVKCEAEKCMYNEACQCCADKIGIIGGNACECRETECATFQCR